MINAIGIALQGLGSAAKQVEQSAEKIANPQDGTDMGEELVNIKVAETSYKANLATFKAADEMADDLLHIFDKHV